MLDTHDVGPARPQAPDPSPARPAPPPLHVHLAAQPPPPSLASFYRLCRLLGFHPLLGAALFGGDWMLGALEAISFGLFAIVSAIVALLLLAPCAVVQRKAYGDDWLLAISKSTIAMILLAIPSPLPSFLTCGLAVAGFIGMKHRDEH